MKPVMMMMIRCGNGDWNGVLCRGLLFWCWLNWATGGKEGRRGADGCRSRGELGEEQRGAKLGPALFMFFPVTVLSFDLRNESAHSLLPPGAPLVQYWRVGERAGAVKRVDSKCLSSHLIHISPSRFGE